MLVSTFKNSFMFSSINLRWAKPTVKSFSLVAALALTATMASGQVTDTIKKEAAPAAPKPADALPVAEKKAGWFDKISLRGYVQLRYNRLLETNSALRSPHDGPLATTRA
jgi:hypothetical protein